MTCDAHGADTELTLGWPDDPDDPDDLVDEASSDATAEALELAVRQGCAPRVIPEAGPEADLAAAELAAGQFLRALGWNWTRKACGAPPGGWPAPTPSCSPRARST